MACVSRWCCSGRQRVETRMLLLVLCGYVFCTQFTPSEPYLVPYLIQDKHFTNKEVTTHIFPVSVYFMLLFTLLAAPACGLLSYRTVIIIGTFGKLGTFIILRLGKSLLTMQLMQVTYALGYSVDMVFSSFLFTLVSEDGYQVLTSATQATSKVSFLIAAELGQLLVYKHFPLENLLQITILMVGCACLAVFLLPKDQRKLENEYDVLPSSSSHTGPFMINLFFSRQSLHDIVQETWKSEGLQLLSFWWAFQTAGSAMVANYATNIFDAINPLSMYNGHVLAASHGVACIAALAAVPANGSAETGGFLFAFGSALTGSICLLIAWSKSLWIAYPAYVVNAGVNQFLLCLLYVQCAKFLSNGQYVILFSLNTLAGYIVQALFQAAMEIFDLSVVLQFYFLAIHFLSLAIIFAILCVLRPWKSNVVTQNCGTHEHDVPPNSSAKGKDDFMDGRDRQALP